MRGAILCRLGRNKEAGEALDGAKSRAGQRGRRGGARSAREPGCWECTGRPAGRGREAAAFFFLFFFPAPAPPARRSKGQRRRNLHGRMRPLPLPPIPSSHLRDGIISRVIPAARASPSTSSRTHADMESDEMWQIRPNARARPAALHSGADDADRPRADGARHPRAACRGAKIYICASPRGGTCKQGFAFGPRYRRCSSAASGRGAHGRLLARAPPA